MTEEFAPLWKRSLSTEFATALVLAQGEIEGAVKDHANPAFRSKYADLGACWDACRDALQKHGLAVLQWPVTASVGHIGLMTCLVFKTTGEVMCASYELPLKDPTNPQAAGSAITYARRYALCSVIGICPVDDDGNAASKKPKAEVRSERSIAGTTINQDSLLSFQAMWDAAKTKDARKGVYVALRGSTVPETEKLQTLTLWGKEIKEMP